MEKLVWISDDPFIGTGFATVTKEILKLLSGYEIFLITQTQVPREPYPVKTAHGSFTVHSSYTWNGVREYLDDIEPDKVILYGAFWHLNEYRKVVPYKVKFKEILYIVVDCPDLPENLAPLLQTFDLVLTPSKFSAQELSKIGIESKVLYHGVNRKIFRPIKIPHPSFTYGTVAKNNVRKALNRLLKAYSLLNFESKLKCFTNPRDPKGWRLDQQAVNLKIDQWVHFYKSAVYGRGVPQEEMPYIYNQFDVFVLPTCGESFCLPVLEAAACKIPALVTDLPVFHEIYGDAVLYAKVASLDFADWGTLSLVDEVDLAEKMYKLYTDEKLRESLSEKAYTVSFKFNWESVVERLEAYLEEA